MTRQEPSAAAVILALVRKRVSGLLAAETYEQAMQRTVNLDVLLTELAVAEHAAADPERTT